MFSSNKKIILCIIIFFLLNISSVCGADISATPDDSGLNGGVNELDENFLTDSVDEAPACCGVDDEIDDLDPVDDLDDGCSAAGRHVNVLGDSSASDGLVNEIAPFDDLKTVISKLKPGDVYNFDRDYCFFLNDSKAHEGITINVDNITLNGNGHVIDGNNQTTFFTINAKNVKIFNLTFINGQYHGQNASGLAYIYSSMRNFNYTYDLSPIMWKGDNGLICDCVFSGNTAINGGAISWFGKNGIIENLTFINNTSRGVGGAIYLIGCNNTIRNSSFLDSFSKLTGESIFVAQECADYQISGTFNSKTPIIMGSQTNITPELLLYSYISCVSDIYIDMIPVLYTSILLNNKILYNKDLYFFPQYNGTDFILTFGRSFDNSSVIYAKNYCFSDVSCFNDVFLDLAFGNFKNEVIFSYSVDVDDNEEYENAINTKSSVFDKYMGLNSVKTDLNQMSSYSLSKLFYVDIYCSYYNYIDSKKTWNPSDSGFDAIIIDGHGSRVKVSSGKRDENKFACIKKNNTMLMVKNLTIEGFNCAIENLGGTCLLENLTLAGNLMDYITDPDYGAGIRNAGTCTCINCIFKNNYCKYGAAIFSQGLLVVDNCTFENNTAYGKGNDICNNDAIVILDGVEINGTQGIVEHVEGLDVGSVALISFAAVAFTYIISSIVSVVSLNPLAGLAVGACVGALVGTVAASIICTNVYDFTYNKLLTAVIVIGVCVVVGALAGYTYSNPQVAYTQAQLNKVEVATGSSIWSEEVDSSSILSQISN